MSFYTRLQEERGKRKERCVITTLLKKLIKREGANAVESREANNPTVTPTVYHDHNYTKRNNLRDSRAVDYDIFISIINSQGHDTTRQEQDNRLLGGISIYDILSFWALHSIFLFQEKEKSMHEALSILSSKQVIFDRN